MRKYIGSKCPYVVAYGVRSEHQVLPPKSVNSKTKNSKSVLRDEEGVEHSGSENAGKLFVLYFHDMFEFANPSLISQALTKFQARVSNEMNGILSADHRVEEVSLALSQMHPVRAPGLDGMCHLFFQTYWHVVGKSFTYAVIGTLRGDTMSGFLKETFIVLILQKKKAGQLSDF